MTSGELTGVTTKRDPLAYRYLLATAGVLGMLGVLIGAFGAHGLENFLIRTYLLDGAVVAKRQDQFDVGARYHLVHAVALVAICSIRGISPTAIRAIAVFMMVGIVLFSGSLYLLVATNTTWLGAITPIGGVSWIIGWTMIAVAAIRAPKVEV
jgi:uncharacterized membrane protein YgdD (TMEM256/DUF423 family)